MSDPAPKNDGPRYRAPELPEHLAKYLSEGPWSAEDSAAVLEWLEHGGEPPECVPPELRDY